VGEAQHSGPYLSAEEVLGSCRTEGGYSPSTESVNEKAETIRHKRIPTTSRLSEKDQLQVTQNEIWEEEKYEAFNGLDVEVVDPDEVEQEIEEEPE
jgi:hypothetical protein